MRDEFLEKLASVTTLEEAKDLIKDNSDSFTDEEKAVLEATINGLNEKMVSDSKVEMNELSDDELEEVAGGRLPWGYVEYDSSPESESSSFAKVVAQIYLLFKKVL